MEKKATKKSVLRTIFSVIVNIILYTFFALCIFSFFMVVAAKKKGEDTIQVFGYEARIVISPSMEKCDQTDVSAYKIKDIPVHSMVFVELVPEEKQEAEKWFSELRVGDVLTFYWTQAGRIPVTHRIIEIETKENGKGYIITLQGDNKAIEEGDTNTVVGQQVIDTEYADVTTNYIIGKVQGQSRVLGFVVTILKQPVGLVCVVIIPCALIIIWQIFRIFGALGEEKKEKTEAVQKQQSEEIERLKKQLEEMQKSNGDKDDP